MELILVRHTTLNVREGICYGQSDILPSATFKEEAKKVAKVLVTCSPDVVFTSPLSRCTMLAAEVGYSDAIKDQRLLEYNFGDWEMMPWANIHGEYARKWMEDYISWPAPNGDSMEDLVRRMDDFIIDIKTKDYKKVLCFTHSGPIRIAMHLKDKIPMDKLFDQQVEFGGVYSFSI